MVRGLRGQLTRLIVVLVALVLLGAPQVARAVEDAGTVKGLYSWGTSWGGCNYPDQYDTATLTVNGGARMEEYGKSGTTQFVMEFQVFKQGQPEWRGPEYRYTYRTPTFPNDGNSYEYPGVGYQYHQFRNLPSSYKYYLKVKFRWVRDNARDIRQNVYVGTCAIGG